MPGVRPAYIFFPEFSSPRLKVEAAERFSRRADPVQRGVGRGVGGYYTSTFQCWYLGFPALMTSSYNPRSFVVTGPITPAPTGR